MEKFPIPELKYLLNQSYCEETSFTPEIWTKENPTYGHCAVTTLIVKNFAGGRIQKAFVPNEWKDQLGYPSHYWNVLESGKKEDLTRKQFPLDFPYDDFVEGKIGEQPDKLDKEEYLLSNSHTRKRYELLMSKVQGLLKENPIFTDEKFQRCWELAFSQETVCPKMKFGCVVYNDEQLIAETSNKLMTIQFGRERFCSFDGKECIRLPKEEEGKKGITSRMDANLGDCGHSIPWALKGVFQLGYRPSDIPNLDFYEAGFFTADFSPWKRKEPVYSCIGCQNTFAIFDLDKVWGVYNGAWTKLYT